jgi:hypothetical protein
LFPGTGTGGAAGKYKNPTSRPSKISGSISVTEKKGLLSARIVIFPRRYGFQKLKFCTFLIFFLKKVKCFKH